MIIVLKQHAPADKVQALCNELNSMGFQINDSVGSDTHILGLIGDTKALAESWVLANPVVETCRRVSEPYKKANRKFHPDDTIVDVGGHKIGGGYFAVMSGPCSVESKEQTPTSPSACRPPGPASCAAARSSPAPARTASRACVLRVWSFCRRPARSRASPS